MFLKSGTVGFSATDWLHPTRKPQQGNTTAVFVTDRYGVEWFFRGAS